MDEARRKSYTVGELAKAAETTPRTVRFYQAEGLMPSAGQRGRYTTYGPEHLDRLRVIQQLKRAYLPLSAIRTQIARLTPAQIRLIAEHDVQVVPRDSADAAAYVTKLIEARTPRGNETRRSAGKVLVVSTAGNIGSRGEMWLRVRVVDGVELHLREGELVEESVQECVEAIRSIVGR